MQGNGSLRIEYLWTDLEFGHNSLLFNVHQLRCTFDSTVHTRLSVSFPFKTNLPFILHMANLS